MEIRIISFSEKGCRLAELLAGKLKKCGAQAAEQRHVLLPDSAGGDAGDIIVTAERCGRGTGLREWTASAFASADALVFVGAAGIAVRATAPFVRDKTVDPAVVAVDECARYAVPLLSGHLGGANDLARMIAAVCGAEAVITTATDRNGAFAVDEWARRQGCAIVRPQQIRNVSSKILAGDTVYYNSDYVIRGRQPSGLQPAGTGTAACDFRLSMRTTVDDALLVVPRIAVLGIGCRKGTPAALIEEGFVSFMRENGMAGEALALVCSIDIKQDEPGLVGFCRRRGVELKTFSAARLQAVPGRFSASDFVMKTTGTDNVCERSAVLGSGGKLLIPKCAAGGVTYALAVPDFEADWRWQFE